MEQAQQELYVTDNIIIGMGEVPARRGKEGVVWVLPGRQLTSNRIEAITAALELDRLIKSGLKKQTNRYPRR